MRNSWDGGAEQKRRDGKNQGIQKNIMHDFGKKAIIIKEILMNSTTLNSEISVHHKTSIGK